MGSSIDPETGAFVWQPGVAFVGDYQLVIVRTGPGGSLAERRVRVRLLAR
jgi:hypothetical protein